MPTKKPSKAQKPSPKKREPKAAESAPPASPVTKPAERGDKTDAKWRAAEERLGLRLAVLEDVVRRANADLGRRLGELEKRQAVTP